jgi:hypothetical protein
MRSAAEGNGRLCSKRCSFAPLLLVATCAACASSAAAPHAPPAGAPIVVNTDRARTTAFADVEQDAIGWLAAADPRLASRTETTPPDEVLKRIGTEAVLAEDATAQVRGASLDLFAFRARRHALDEAAKTVAAFQDPLPETGPLGATLARPKLERELLERLIEEELARAGEEAELGDASGDLVRGIVSTWVPPSAPQDWPDRDAWVSKHLLEIRESLRDNRPRTGPSDLDAALYPLERLLAPLQFPRGSAAIAEVRMALDRDMRPTPPMDGSHRVALAAKVHLGVALDPATLPSRLERTEQRLRELAAAALTLEKNPSEVLSRARELLLVEKPCPTVPDSRVRSMAPPPERAVICGALRAFAEEASSAAALVALHDDVLFSFASVVSSPPTHTRLLSHPEDDEVMALQRRARERPVPALGVAFAAELLYAKGDPAPRLRAWRALGEAPLDIVARELP